MILKREHIYYLFLTYLFFMPSASWFGGMKAGIIFLFLILALVLLFFLFDLKTPSSALFILGMLYIPLCISLSINSEHIVLNDTFEFIRITLYVFIFLFAYNFGQKVKYDYFVKLAMLFLFFELIFTIIQRLEVESVLNILRLIGSDEKNWKFRNTGSFTNPNNLAFFVILNSIIVIIGQSSKKIKIFFLFIAFFTIILTGSRAGFVSFIFLTSLASIDFEKLSFFSVFKFVGLLFVLGSLFYILGYYYAEENKYIFELLNVLETRDLKSVKTFSYRIVGWQEKFMMISYFDYFFGLGPGKGIGLKYVDNDYLATFFKYGFFGSLITIFVYGYIIFSSYKHKVRFYSKLVFLYILLLLIYSISVETFTSWFLVLPLFMIFGLIMQISNLENK